MDDEIVMFGTGFLLSMMIALVLLAPTLFEYDLSEETLIDICKNLTNQNITDYNITSDGKLECIVPSYDHTTNIIIKRAGE